MYVYYITLTHDSLINNMLIHHNYNYSLFVLVLVFHLSYSEWWLIC